MVEVDIKELFFLIQEFQPFLYKKIPDHEIESHLFLLDLVYDHNLRNNLSWRYYISTKKLDGFGIDSFFYNHELKEYALIQMKHKSIGSFSKKDFISMFDDYNIKNFEKFNAEYFFLCSLSSQEALDASTTALNGLVESSTGFNSDSYFFRSNIKNTGKKTFWINKSHITTNLVNSWAGDLGLATTEDHNKLINQLIRKFETNQSSLKRGFPAKHYFTCSNSILKLLFKKI